MTTVFVLCQKQLNASGESPQPSIKQNKKRSTRKPHPSTGASKSAASFAKNKKKKKPKPEVTKPTKVVEVEKSNKRKLVKVAAVVGILALAVLAVALTIYFLTDDNDRQEDSNMQVTDA